MITKRILLIVAMWLLILSLAAPAAFAKEYKLKFGTLAPDNTPWSDLLKKTKTQLKERSNGDVTVKLYLNGSLGDERAMLQKMRFGQLTGGGFSTGGMGTVLPELQLLELPCLFQNDAEADYVMDKVIFDEFKKKLADKGLYLWLWAVNGWLDLGFKGKSPKTVGELQGIKFFMQESDAQKLTYAVIGAQAVPLPVPDVLSGLQTGLVEAYLSTPIFATGAQWFTQTTYWLDSDIMYQPATVVVDMKFWEELPQNYKDIMIDIAPKLQMEARRDVRGLDEKLFAGFRKSGMTIDKLATDQREAFCAKTRPTYDQFVQQGIVSRELMDRVLKSLEEFRKNGGK